MGGSSAVGLTTSAMVAGSVAPPVGLAILGTLAAFAAGAAVVRGAREHRADAEHADATADIQARLQVLMTEHRSLSRALAALPEDIPADAAGTHERIRAMAAVFADSDPQAVADRLVAQPSLAKFLKSEANAREEDSEQFRLGLNVLIDDALEQRRFRPEVVEKLNAIDTMLADIHQDLRDVASDVREIKNSRFATQAATLDRRFSLPPVPTDFTGRVKELDDLLGRITGGATISAVRGMGGIGKTALALVLAHKFKEAYPDGHILVEMRGTATGTEKPLTSAEAMAQIVRAFHPEIKLPERDEEVAAIYHSELNGKKVLLLLDNAANRAQVERLLPPEGCLLLVTSRTRFELPGLTKLDLGVLAEDDAKKLLLRLCERIGEDAAALAKLCGRLPLALRLAGDALAGRDELAVADYMRRLEAERLTQLERYADSDEATVTASLKLSETLLRERDPGLADRWLVMGVFPADFDVPAAAAVWGLPLTDDEWRASVDEAGDALGELRVRSMVEWDRQTKRYRLHDLVREYVLERCELDAAENAGLRHAEHFCNILTTADVLYRRHGNGTKRGLDLFDTERENIDAGRYWSAERMEADIVATQLCSDYPEVSANVLFLRQDPLERIAWLQSGLDAAERLDSRESVAIHSGNLGITLLARGDLNGAETLFRRALAMNTELSDKKGQASSYGNLGLVLRYRGDLAAAESMHRRSLAIDKELGHKEGMATSYGNLGIVLAIRGDLDASEAMFRKALAIDQELGRSEGVADHYGNLGNVLKSRGDLDGAQAMLRMSLAIYEDVGRKDGIATTHGNLGNILFDRGNLNGAEAAYRKCLAINEELGRKAGMANSYASLGVIAGRRGDVVGARRLWTLARDLYAQMGTRPDVEQIQGWLDDLPPA